MTQLGPSQYTVLDYDADGALKDPSAFAALNALVAAPDVTDLVVISHGWKNSPEDAKKLYGTLWGHVCTNLTRIDPRKVVVAGVVWPAKTFRTEFDQDVVADSGQASAQSAGRRAPKSDLGDDQLQLMLGDFEDVFGAGTDDLRNAASAVVAKNSTANAHSFMNALRSRLQEIPNGDPEADEHRKLFNGNPKLKIDGLQQQPTLPKSGAGGAQSLGGSVQMIEGVRGAIGRLLNQATYFFMKQRAGAVGTKLGSETIAGLTLPANVRLHLIGHSFGARLVTAAASALTTKGMKLFSLTLLQGAFSHNSMSTTAFPGRPGMFSNVVGAPPSGPVAITHTHNDLACTYAYALASRLSIDTATGIGDASDVFGAMGANGAQHLATTATAPEDVVMAFQPRSGLVNNVLADAFIKKDDETGIDAHNNVATADVGRLVARVLEAREEPTTA